MFSTAKQNLLQNPSKAAESPPYLFVFLEIFSHEGGIQSYVRELLQSYLSLSDHPKADIFLLRDGRDCENPLQSDVLKFHYFKTQSVFWSRFRLAAAILFYLLRYRPQHVFCGHMHLAPLSWLVCKPLGIPYTIMTHGKEVWLRQPLLARLALQQADRIWSVSRYSRDRAAQSNQLDPQKMQLLPCPIDGDRFKPAAKSAALIDQYGLAGAKVILTVARLWSGDPYKGVDITIRALPAIAAAVPNVKYLVIGRGDDQPRLASLAQELGMGDRVVFAGFVSAAELAAHYRLADAYVMPSQEGFGIVYLEAMVCGVPVLSGDADGSADPLQDGELGWRVAHRDSQAVAQACIEMLTTQDPRTDAGWLRQRAIELFGKAAFTQRLQALLKPQATD
ncbi:glycosyltransferase [Phormidium tenue FACHB-886]|nr:glycosyltransferase [Phormidium tenue FACHB-886]